MKHVGGINPGAIQTEAVASIRRRGVASPRLSQRGGAQTSLLNTGNVVRSGEDDGAPVVSGRGVGLMRADGASWSQIGRARRS